MTKKISHSLILIFLFISSTVFSQNDSENGVDGYTSIADALKNPASATKIWITGNPSEIKLFSYNVSSFKNLAAFKIRDGASETGWDQLFTEFSKCNSLKELELTFNDIKTIPSSVSGLKNLEKLTIWGSPDLNYIALFKDLSRLRNLKALELNSNAFLTIPAEIKSLQSLESFTITDNETTNYSDLVEKLSALPLLKNLSLEVNSITELPSNIIKLKNLKKLNISNNYISSFPDKMSELNNLDSLQADGNLFVNYVDEFNKLKGINISYLSIDGTLTEEEKSELLKLFPKAKVDEKANAEPIAKPQQAEPAKDLFEPVVPALAVPKSNYSIDATQNAAITYPSGTELKIPANAFVDKNNKPVTGNINVAYREFSNPVDIAFSGIPMDFSNGNVSYPMQSAGMFQIDASKDGQPIYLKKGTGINVSLVTSDTANNYNYYNMDPATKQWIDEGKQGTIKIARKDGTLSDSLQAASQLKIYSSAWKEYRKVILENDTMLFNSRFYDSSYCHTIKYRYFFNSNRGYERFIQISKYKKQGHLFKKPAKNEVWFNLANYVGEPNGNPELHAFGNMVWVYEGTETPKEFSKKFLRKKRYSDIRIERSGDSFIIHLKEQYSIIDLPAHPINRYKGAMEKVQKAYDRRFRNYTKALARREKQFNRNLFQNKKRFNRNVWKNLKPRMSDIEKKMTYEQWLTYFDALDKIYPDSLVKANKSLDFLSTNSTKYRRDIYVTQLGYHNFDSPAGILLGVPLMPVFAVDALIRGGYAIINEPKLFANITASYTDKQGNLLKPTYVMVIDKRMNSVNTLGAGVNMRLAILSNKNLLAVMQNGSVGLFSEEDFKNVKLRNNENYTFSLQVYTPNELQQLKDYLKY